MKRLAIIILVGMFFCHEAPAQKWLKKLGEIVEKVDNALSTVDGTDKSETKIFCGDSSSGKGESKASATPDVFKGEWSEESDNHSALIKLNLTSKTIDSEEGPCYGIISFSSLSPMRMDEHAITKVVSVNGNIAEIEQVCGYSGCRRKGTLKYHPDSGKMEYVGGPLVSEDEEDYGCEVCELILPKGGFKNQ